jgi:hypothetical protein
MRQHSLVLSWPEQAIATNEGFYHYTIASHVRKAYRQLRQGSYSTGGGGWNQGINADAARRVIFDTLFASNIASSVEFQVESPDNPNVRRTPIK